MTSPLSTGQLRSASLRQVGEGSGAWDASSSFLPEARAFFAAARSPLAPRFRPGDEQALNRPDLDWPVFASYLASCGVARPLLAALDVPAIKAAAPALLADRIRREALRDGLREAVQREILGHVQAALDESGERGVLLKGMALLALGLSPLRAASDVDLVAGEAARGLRERLLARGFAGLPDDPRTAPHHLAPVSWRGGPVEIHVRVMPRFWGFPETPLLEGAKPAARFPALLVPSPEALVLHAAIHASAHLYTHGLKTAWDLALLLGRFPDLDWERLAALVRLTRLRRAFWVPFGVLARDLDLPVPEAFLRGAPADARQRRLELIARHRFFSSVEGAFDLNPWTKNAVFLQLHDSPFGAARYLAHLLGPEERAARTTGLGKAPAPLRTQLREALREYGEYRRAVARARTR